LGTIKRKQCRLLIVGDGIENLDCHWLHMLLVVTSLTKVWSQGNWKEEGAIYLKSGHMPGRNLNSIASQQHECVIHQNS
jgi:hypothetical protein